MPQKRNSEIRNFSTYVGYLADFPGGSAAKEPTWQSRRCKRPWVWPLSWEDPLEKEMATTPVLLPGKFHGWRSIVCYSPWGCKESDTSERLHFHFHFHFLCNTWSSINIFVPSDHYIELKSWWIAKCNISTIVFRDFYTPLSEFEQSESQTQK